ncbi:DUF2007 domain-containing protein [bacterium]|nr:DUF2007 domain-containing protein [bacterium]
MSELIEGWAVVRTVDYEHQADMICDLLAAAGIESTVLSQKDHMNVVWVGDLSAVKVLVPKEQLNAALEVVKDIELPEMALEEDADVGEEGDESEDEDENDES